MVKTFLILLLVTSFHSCEKTVTAGSIKESETTPAAAVNIPEEEVVVEDSMAKKLDLILDNNFCDTNYAFFEGHFYYPDYGCIYTGLKNSLGNSSVYLVPKVKSQDTSDELIDKELHELENATADYIKDKYYVALFLVEAKYLKKVIVGEGNYYADFPYKKLCIYFNSNIGKWVIKNTYEIKSINDEQAMIKKCNDIVKQLNAD